MPHRSALLTAICAASAVILVGATACAIAGSDDQSPMQFLIEQQQQPLRQTQPSIRHRAPAFARPHVPRAAFDRRPPQFTVTERRPPSRPAAAAPAATRVMVYGDRFALALAGGLAEDAGASVAVTSLVTDDAGLTRTDFGAWLDGLRERLKAERRPAIAVMMLGSNDLKPIADAGASLDPSSERWKDLYGARISAVAAVFHQADMPLIWVGLPSVRDTTQSTEFVRLNSIIRDAAERGGATYVDIWEAFSDDAGRYSAIGPDVEGDTVKLRRADGAGFTRAGARKLASFVTGDIKKLRGPSEKPAPATDVANITIDRARDFDQALDIDINAQIRREAGLQPGGSAAGEVPPPPAAGPVIELTAAPLSPGGQLAGATPPGALQANLGGALGGGSPAPATEAQRGRADDFAWPRP